MIPSRVVTVCPSRTAFPACSTKRFRRITSVHSPTARSEVSAVHNVDVGPPGLTFDIIRVTSPDFVRPTVIILLSLPLCFPTSSPLPVFAQPRNKLSRYVNQFDTTKEKKRKTQYRPYTVSDIDHRCKEFQRFEPLFLSSIGLKAKTNVRLILRCAETEVSLDGINLPLDETFVRLAFRG